LCSSIAEYRREATICSEGSGNDPFLRCDESAARLALTEAIRDRFLIFRRSRRTPGLFDETLRLPRLSRFADDCRLPPLCFECLPKMVGLRILLRRSTRPSPVDRQLVAARGVGLGKLVELFLQVKDLFLQIYYLSGTQVWEFYLVGSNIKLPPQNSLANA